MPGADSVHLPGGYPELHLQALAGNLSMKQALHVHHRLGKPLYAESGGFLYLLDGLADLDGNCAAMAGLLPVPRGCRSGLAAIGDLPAGEIRGHSFHYSRLETKLQAVTTSVPQGKRGKGEGFLPLADSSIQFAQPFPLQSVACRQFFLLSPYT